LAAHWELKAVPDIPYLCLESSWIKTRGGLDTGLQKGREGRVRREEKEKRKSRGRAVKTFLRPWVCP